MNTKRLVIKKTTGIHLRKKHHFSEVLHVLVKKLICCDKLLIKKQ